MLAENADTGATHAPTDGGGHRLEPAARTDGEVDVRYYKKDFWKVENPKYTKAHYRLRKSARLVNQVAAGRPCRLLDVGCGPASLRRLLPGNIDYHGIDISIPEPGPGLIEMDLLASPIALEGERFDIVLAQGLFEYLGDYQAEKLAELARLVRDDGTFVVSYVNFGHRAREIYWPYNNVQSFEEFRGSLSRHFVVRRFLPTSHNWRHNEPNRRLIAAPNMFFNVNVPVVTRRLAVEYFFLCSPRRSLAPSAAAAEARDA